MRVFHFEDKRKKVGFRGIVPNNDVNCLHCRLTFAYHMDLLFSDKLKARGLPHDPDDERLAFVLKKVDEEIIEVLAVCRPQPQIFEILTNENSVIPMNNSTTPIIPILIFGYLSLI